MRRASRVSSRAVIVLGAGDGGGLGLFRECVGVLGGELLQGADEFGVSPAALAMTWGFWPFWPAR